MAGDSGGDRREPSFPRYGEVVATVPTVAKSFAHHTEHVMPTGGMLFQTDLGPGETYLDLIVP